MLHQSYSTYLLFPAFTLYLPKEGDIALKMKARNLHLRPKVHWPQCYIFTISVLRELTSPQMILHVKIWRFHLFITFFYLDFTYFSLRKDFWGGSFVPCYCKFCRAKGMSCNTGLESWHGESCVNVVRRWHGWQVIARPSVLVGRTGCQCVVSPAPFCLLEM